MTEKRGIAGAPLFICTCAHTHTYTHTWTHSMPSDIIRWIFRNICGQDNKTIGRADWKCLMGKDRIDIAMSSFLFYPMTQMIRCCADCFAVVVIVVDMTQDGSIFVIIVVNDKWHLMNKWMLRKYKRGWRDEIFLLEMVWPVVLVLT